MKSFKLSSFLVWLGILLAGLLSSCNIDTNRSRSALEEKSFDIEHFKRIEMDGGYHVTLQQSDSTSLTVITPESNMKRIRVSNHGNTLRIKNNVNNVTAQETKLTITFDSLEYIKIRGGVNLETNGELNLDDFEIDVEGGANISIKLNANIFRAKSQGGVNMDLRGRVDQFYASSEGAGNIDAGRLESRYVKCRVAGVGNATVYPTEKLDATVEGIGKIGYRGDPVVNKTVNGIGLVYRR
jgi:hypothetical protein